MLNIPINNVFLVDNYINDYIKENLFKKLHSSIHPIILEEQNSTFNYPIRFELNKKLNESYTI